MSINNLFYREVYREIFRPIAGSEGGELPPLPAGQAFLVDDSGNYLIDDNNNYLTGDE